MDGIADIQTNVTDRTCTFRVTDPDLDYRAKLAELAGTNEHIAGYQIE